MDKKYRLHKLYLDAGRNITKRMYRRPVLYGTIDFVACYVVNNYQPDNKKVINGLAIAGTILIATSLYKRFKYRRIVKKRDEALKRLSIFEYEASKSGVSNVGIDNFFVPLVDFNEMKNGGIGTVLYFKDGGEIKEVFGDNYQCYYRNKNSRATDLTRAAITALDADIDNDIYVKISK